MASRSGNRSKHKKPVPTTLGKAPPNSNSEFIDLSHLRKPIDTSLFGLSQILSLFETATDEVRRYIAYECELMFECRVCRTVYRSLANFILHKRNYCEEFFNPLNNIDKADFEDNELAVIDKDKLPCTPNEQVRDVETTPKRYPRRNLSLVLQKLSDSQECQKMVENIANEELTEEKQASEVSTTKMLCLETIDNNKEGVFQTMNSKQIGSDLMKSEVMEIHSILNTNEAILGPDGKVFSFRTEVNDSSGHKLMCTICNLKFATKKTLTHHIKYKHNETRIVYICPECKDSFANAWCVFRHLYKIHRKTTAQIRRMRDQIHASAIVKKQGVANKKSSGMIEEKEKSDRDNQSNNLYQDFESQCCEGCGKRFDRRAALNSHIQSCLKRIAANNVSKEKEVQGLIDKQSIDSVKGSRRRKPEILHRILKNNNLELTVENEKESCTSEATLIEDGSNIEQTVEFSVNNNDSPNNGNGNSDTVEDIIPNNVTTHAKDIASQKRLIQEIIFGNSKSTSDECLSVSHSTDKYIGLVSDEEEVLGFVKQSDVLIKDKDKSEEDSEQSEFLIKDMPDKNMEGIIEDVIASTDETPEVNEDVVVSTNEMVEVNEDVFPLTEEANVNENVIASIDERAQINEEILVIEDDEELNSIIELEPTKIYIPAVSQFHVQNLIGQEIEVGTTDKNSTLLQDEIRHTKKGREQKRKQILKPRLIDNENQTVANQNVADEEVNALPKITVLRQYAAKKARSGNLNKPMCTSSEELTNEVIVNRNIDNSSNIDTTDIDLSPEIQSTDIAIAAEYDVTDVIDIISESEESASCSCFDDKSNDTCTSYSSNKSGNNFNKANENSGITAEQLEAKRLSRKRKNSTEIQADDSNSTLVNKCNDYVDWNCVMCLPCSKTFSSQHELLKHMALHFNWLQYQCNICNFISYDKVSCMQHTSEHDINIDSINNFIVSLPYWKTLCMATPFNQNIEDEDTHLEDRTTSNDESMNINKTNNTDENINKDEASLTCSVNKLKTQDPFLRKMIMEVIFGSEQDAIKGPAESNLNTRPIRNRVSVKTLQKDFEYDMKQIDSKVKKSTVDNKVKPIKIVKNNEENFCVVKSNISQGVCKKKRTY